VKSGLEGNHGSNVFAPAYPQSQMIDCDTSVPSDAAEPIVFAGSDSLRRHAKEGQYSFVWKTDKAWAGQCRQLVINFIDGKSHTSVFKFTE